MRNGLSSVGPWDKPDRMLRLALIGALAVVPAGCGGRGPVTIPGVVSPDHSLAIERGRNIVAPLVRRGAGVTVAVGVDGEVVWSEGFGRTAMGDGAPVRPELPFRVFSLMKQVTAVLALQAAVRGEVDMGGSVRDVIPTLPEAYEGVTLQHLLTHTGGVRHYRDESEAAMTGHCGTAAEALPLFVDDPLVTTPGTRESYSTWGFVLASAVLEQAAGMPFPSLLEMRILEPAGMRSTRLEGEDDPAMRISYYDAREDGDSSRTPPLDASCKMGGGGFVASAEDIVRFHNAVLRGELVPLAAVRQMLGGRTALLTAGSGAGGNAVAQVDLDSRISVVLLSNTSGLEQQIALERARGLLAGVFAGDP